MPKKQGGSLGSQSEETKPPKPDKPCHVCGGTDWWWPGDSYVGKKTWICVRCHPCPVEVMK